MKVIKGAILFLAGVVCTSMILDKGLEKDAKRPRVGSIEFENDTIRVVRMTEGPMKKGNIAMAAILYKDEPKETV